MWKLLARQNDFDKAAGLALILVSPLRRARLLSAIAGNQANRPPD